jgi:hypothetical protein
VRLKALFNFDEKFIGLSKKVERGTKSPPSTVRNRQSERRQHSRTMPHMPSACHLITFEIV